MARLLWLPQVLRAAGLTVHEVDGWRTRGADTYGPVRGITCHATAGSRTSTDAGEIRVLLTGSTSAPPPIAQLYLGRQGHWWVVASGACNHNRVGWAGPNEGFGNDALLGIEAANDNRGEPWPAVQYQSYVRGVAALVRHKAPGYDVVTARVAGHKEHQPGSKSDPTFDMNQFRVAVARVLAGEDDDMTPEQATQLRRVHDFLFGVQLRERTGAQLLKDLWYAEFAGNSLSRRQQAEERIEAGLRQLGAVVAADDVDEAAVAAAVLTVLTPQAIAAAVPAEVAAAVAEELAARLAG